MVSAPVQKPASYHIAVMVREVLDYLQVKPSGIYLDGTVGAGGHGLEILNILTASGKLIGLDRDAQALEICNGIFGAAGGSFFLFKKSYHTFPGILSQAGVKSVNGLLLDLGLSSLQLNSTTRGFAFQSNGLLDMRFDPRTGITAAQLISQSSAEELANIFYQYGEERDSRKIARFIKNFNPLNSVADLKEAIRRCTAPKQRNRTLARIFQALRITVNQELERLEKYLDIFIDYLSVGGRVVIISYHSLEDRLVKHAFKNLKQAGRIKILTKKPISPTAEEQTRNSRSRAAKLRAAERIN
ncbi:MAG: 16S rRNA (cytosine(1402)-N(4))-methyltransferase RsmH [Candidatus Neomarinimicrobiota bacterium]